MNIPDRIPPRELRSLARQILVKCGVPEHVAGITATVLVSADARGIHSHGVSRLPVYVRRIQNGAMTADPRLAIVNDFGATMLIDGGNGLGQYAAHEAMTGCIKKAREFGIGTIGIRNNNHIGMAAYFSMMALEHEMIGITLNNASPHVAPWGGKTPLIGTNPISIAVPTGLDFPIVLDMATTVVARGRIILADKANKTLPQGWAFDADGQPAVDPSKVLHGGSLMPIGGYKGYGLSLCIDILSGLLTGALFGPLVPPMAPDGQAKLNQGVLMMALAIDRFMPPEQFKTKTEFLVNAIKTSTPKEGVAEIYLPGEIEHRRAKASRANGIALDRETATELGNLATSL